jgi:hypothetical protein
VSKQTILSKQLEVKPVRATTNSFIFRTLPLQGARLQQQTSLLSLNSIGDTIRFQADSSNTTDRPYSLSQTELDKLSLKEKQQLFAKLPLLKYQGKPLTGSEFLNLVYHFPYPEKNAWVSSRPIFQEIVALTLFGLPSVGLFPIIAIGQDNRLGKIPVFPRKGISKIAFETFCENLTTLKVKIVDPIRIVQLLTELKLIYSHGFKVMQFKILPNEAPVTFTNAAKRLLKNPIHSFPTQSVLNNHTFANQLEEPLA